jgi:glycine/D-amino acid oxidase-like deaminating enzyme
VQVHPELLTKAMVRHVEEAGGSVVSAAATGIRIKDGKVTGVVIRTAQGEESTLPADAVVFAMGAWSPELQRLLPGAEALPDITGLKVHSLVLADPATTTTADALFLSYKGPGGKTLEPEVYPRPDGSVYLCGISSEEDPPASAADVLPRPSAVTTLRKVAAAVSDDLGSMEVLKEQACFLPCTLDGLPAIGPVPGVSGAYVATGHSCWGILNGPATGLAVAELIVDGKATTVDLAPFSLDRFRGS